MVGFRFQGFGFNFRERARGVCVSVCVLVSYCAGLCLCDRVWFVWCLGFGCFCCVHGLKGEFWWLCRDVRCEREGKREIEGLVRNCEQ